MANTPKVTPAQRRVVEALREGGRLEHRFSENWRGCCKTHVRALYDATGNLIDRLAAPTLNRLVGLDLVVEVDHQRRTVGFGWTKTYALTESERDA